MDKVDYENNVRTLRKNGRLPNPTIDNLKQFCPHLTEEHLASILEKDSWFACPSLLIKNAVIVLHYSTYKNDNTLRYAFVSRRRESYSDSQWHGDGSANTGTMFMDEAIAYANEHWGNALIIDSWKSYMDIYIQDPTKLNKYGHPTTIFILSLALRRNYNQFINEYHKPMTEIFDEEIVVATVNPIISDEIRGGRGGFVEFNCANCGSGLSTSSCNSCGAKFKDDAMRCSWITPLSNKMIETLTSAGHVFNVDPKIAQEKYLVRYKEICQEQEEWERIRNQR